MIVCDLCGEVKDCLLKQTEGKEYDICDQCWEPLAQNLRGERQNGESGNRVATAAQGGERRGT